MFIIKKIITAIIVLFIITTGSTLAFAKERGYRAKHYNVKRSTIALKRGILTIKPLSTTSAAIDPQIAAQIDVVKKTYDNNNNLTSQIITKRASTLKLIMNIKRSGQTLSDDQYTNINNIITTINTEANAIVGIKGINNVIRFANGKNNDEINTITLQDLTTMLEGLNANTTHLNTITASFDTMNATLTNIVNTITTTTSAISN